MVSTEDDDWQEDAEEPGGTGSQEEHSPAQNEEIEKSAFTMEGLQRFLHDPSPSFDTSSVVGIVNENSMLPNSLNGANRSLRWSCQHCWLACSSRGRRSDCSPVARIAAVYQTCMNIE